MRKLPILFFSLFCLVIFLVSSCQTKKSPRDKLYDEVMEIHDNVMPEMSTIHRLKKQLKAIDTITVKSPDYPSILNHLNALDKADEAMMGWMADFDNPLPDASEETAIKYLEKEKVNITTVRDQMRKSINEAETVLAEVKKATADDPAQDH